jgi:glutamate racemase
MFVPFVERGVTSGPELLGLAETYLAPLMADGIDTLVLGCTHYPMLTGLLAVVLGDGVTLVSSAEETAKDVYRTLLANDLLRPDELGEPAHRFEATGPAQPFENLVHRFTGVRPDLLSPAES